MDAPFSNRIEQTNMDQMRISGIELSLVILFQIKYSKYWYVMPKMPNPVETKRNDVINPQNDNSNDFEHGKFWNSQTPRIYWNRPWNLARVYNDWYLSFYNRFILCQNLHDVSFGFVDPLFWDCVLLYMRSPKGSCCSIWDDLSCSS